MKYYVWNKINLITVPTCSSDYDNIYLFAVDAFKASKKKKLNSIGLKNITGILLRCCFTHIKLLHDDIKKLINNSRPINEFDNSFLMFIHLCSRLLIFLTLTLTPHHHPPARARLFMSHTFQKYKINLLIIYSSFRSDDFR